MPIIIPTLSEIPSPQSPPHGGFFVWQLRNNYGSQEQANKPEFITTTPGHPFYVKERSDGAERPKPVGHEDLNSNWIGAGHLKIGDKIKQADGTLGVVANVTTIGQTQEMFNLTVDEAHTFYVGTNGWLVHNAVDCFVFPGVTKSVAKADIPNMGLPSAQVRSATSTVGRATASSSVSVKQVGPNVLVEIYRPGRDGFQVVETLIRQDGTKQVVQKAYDTAGKLVHYDPKK